MWEPEPRVQQLFDIVIVELRDPLVARFHQEDRPRITRELAAQGLVRSGAFLIALASATEDVVREFGDRFIAEVPGRVKQIYGSIPFGASDWVRGLFARHADGLANSLAQIVDVETARMNLVRDGRFPARMEAVLIQLRRRLEIDLQTTDLRAQLAGIAAGRLPSREPGDRIDAFISYASEDRSEVAMPLAEGLTARGFGVWIDQYELKVGMSVYAAIDEGLRRCRFGVVVLSPAFFAKHWPARELHALAALAASEGRDKILPVWHLVDGAAMASYSPLLADVWAARTTDGIEAVIDRIADVLGAEGPA
jgi:hypothetical protein